MNSFQGVILDTDYNPSEEKPGITLYFKNLDTGEEKKLEENSFKSYFYAVPEDKKALEKELEGKADLEEETLLDGRTEKKVLKVIVDHPKKISELKEKAREHGETYETGIKFTKQFLLEKGIKPMQPRTYFHKGKELKKIGEPIEQKKFDLTKVAFDIETYNKRGISDPEEDKVIAASYYTENNGKVITCKKINKDFVKTVKNEDKLIEELEKALRSNNIIYGYNTDNFDFPYLKKRKPDSELAKWIKLRRTRDGYKTKVPGKVHLDCYTGATFLETIGSLNLPRYTLENVYKAFTGKEKPEIDINNLWKNWDKEKELEKIAEYSLSDSEACYTIGEEMIELFKQLSQLLPQTMFETSRSSASKMVEEMLQAKSKQEGYLIPNKPSSEEIGMRARQTIKGGFVKNPDPGLHENIVVADFKSLYPTLSLSHNISPETLNCNCCKNPHKSPTGQTFCKKETGLIPSTLKTLLDERQEIKEKMKELDLETDEYRRLNARQTALKIIANASFGYMDYIRARWYCRECAQAITAWGRKYVKEAIKEAEKEGFEVIYGDTDSVMLKRDSKSKKDVEKFLKKYNSKLPDPMQLELEGFFPRGLFVTKKGGGAAKKRYALITEDGKMEVKGLEVVRKDWANIAKETQRKALKQVLEGNVEKARKTVQETIKKLREGNVKKEDLLIYTRMQKALDSYETTGPHVEAAKKLDRAGKKVKAGMTIRYIVTKGGGSISERAYPMELIKNRNPDPQYYIDNQVLPAVTNILKQVGIKENELKYKGKQSKLGRW